MIPGSKQQWTFKIIIIVDSRYREMLQKKIDSGSGGVLTLVPSAPSRLLNDPSNQLSCSGPFDLSSNYHVCFNYLEDSNHSESYMNLYQSSLLLLFDVFFYNFIYLYLAALGLHSCIRIFSRYPGRALLWSCGGFSCCAAGDCMARGLSSCSSRALEHRLSSCGTRA